MDSKTVISILFLLFLEPFCEGYEQGCYANVTLYVSEGSTAEFTTQNLRLRWYMYFLNTTSSGDDSGIFMESFDSIEDSLRGITFYSPLLEKRMNVSSKDMRSLSILLNDIKPSDNGTYLLRVGGVSEICWTLFVINIEIESQSKYLAEGTYVRFKGNPAFSFVIDQSLNISVVWLFDGHNKTETENFQVTGNWMWIPCVRREHYGKNVTYRVKHGEDVKEVNFTLNVMYGPSWPLTFFPPKTAYYLSPGESLPEITCEVDCYPSCNISWEEFSSGNKLNLGKVSKDTTGEFICRASREGSATVIDRSLYVYVEDTPSSACSISSKIAFVVLGALLTLSTLAFICTLVYLCCKRHMSKTESSCTSCFKKKEAPNPEPNISDVSAVEEHQMESAQVKVHEV